MKFLNTSILVLIVAFGVGLLIKPAFGKTTNNTSRVARESALQDLLSSLDGGVPKESPRTFKTPEGYLRFLGSPPSTYFPVDPNRRVTPTEAADAFLNTHRNLFVNESPAVGFNRFRVKTRDSRSYIRYQQMYGGLKVFGAEMVVQVNSTGGIDAVMSDIMRDTKALETDEFWQNMSIDASTAQDKAIEWMAAKHPQLEFEASEPELMIFDPPVVGWKGPTKLVWHIDVKNVGELEAQEFILLDTTDGTVAFYYSRISYALSTEVWDYNGETEGDGTLILEGPDDPAYPSEIHDDINRAYDYLEDTYNYFSYYHSRDGYNGQGADTIAKVRYGGATGWYGGNHMRIQTGCVTDDLVGHEFAHGVCSSVCGLGYTHDEAGAICEMFCDIWGEFIDQDVNHNPPYDEYEHNDDDDSAEKKWILLEDIGGGNRNMKYPHLSSQACPAILYGDNWYEDGDCPELPPGRPPGEAEKYCFTHRNNLVGDKLCYLLTDGDTFNGHTVEAMGIPTVSALFYEGLHILTSKCEYYDLYHALTHAAKVLEMTWEERVNIEEACQAVEIANDPLVGWWKFDYGSGTTAYDSVGTNNGTLGSAPYDPTWVVDDPDRGRCLDFDVDSGEMDYVSLSPIDALKGNTVTISAWIKARTLSGIYNCILQQYESPNGYYLYVYDYKPKFYLNSSYAQSPDVITVGEWYHVAGTYNGDELKIYVNGVLKYTESEVDETGINHDALIGKFDGRIDDVRVYNWAVDVDEILDKMFYGTSKFSIKNKSGVRVAWFDNLGNLFLKGSKQDWEDPDGQVDEFIIEKNSGPTVYIDDSGNLYLQGDFTEYPEEVPEATGADEFRIQVSQGESVEDVVIIKVSNGNVHIKGKLYENP